MSEGAAVLSAACWIEGRWVDNPDGVHLPPSDVHRVDLSAFDTLGSVRVARADRMTRIAAGVVAQALQTVAPTRSSPDLAVVVASTLASAHTNERFETRRMQRGHGAPRDFAYTAPNAWGGEIAAAIGAQGPSLSLVGGHDVGLLAVARAIRYLELGCCSRVVVVTAECPPDTSHVVVPRDQGVECAAALVLAHAEGAGAARIRARFALARPVSASREPPHFLLSTGPVARLVAAFHERAPTVVFGAPNVGASVVVELRPARPDAA